MLGKNVASFACNFVKITLFVGLSNNYSQYVVHRMKYVFPLPLTQKDDRGSHNSLTQFSFILTVIQTISESFCVGIFKSSILIKFSNFKLVDFLTYESFGA